MSPVYELLADLGMRTTKSVWPLAAPPGTKSGGESLVDDGYRTFVEKLRDSGFEIGLHNVRDGSSRREVVKEGLERFRDTVGSYPRTHVNHDGCRDNLYWGASRLTSPLARAAYRASRARNRAAAEGEVPASPFFWGDLCQQHITYVRSFVFDTMNLLRVNPTLPYHDRRRPYVRRWFTSAEGGNVRDFCRTINEKNQDALEAEGGVCIMYAHLARGFAQNGRVEPEFQRLITRLATKGGWFVPTAMLLDHLSAQRSDLELTISRREQTSMETRWVAWKLRRGTS